MDKRTIGLLAGLGGLVGIYFIVLPVLASLWSPVTELQESIDSEKTSVEKQENDALELARQRKQLAQWKAVALAPDPVPAGAKPGKLISALNAQRLYFDWVTELAHGCGLEDLKILPGKGSSSSGQFAVVTVSVEAHGTGENVARFVTSIENAPLLHRIKKLRMDAAEPIGDLRLTIGMDLEAVVLPELKPRIALLPETGLKAEIDASATKITVADGQAIKLAPPFFARLGESELVSVKEANTTTGVWTVERGVEGTKAAAHPAGELLRPAGMMPQREQHQQIAKFLADLRFLKPVPPKKYDPQLKLSGESLAYRGKPFEQKLTLSGATGTASVRLKTPAPEGVTFDGKSMQLRWTPAKTLKEARYDIGFDILSGEDDKPAVSRTISLTVRDENTAPKISNATAPLAIIGRPWTVTLEATDAQTPVGDLSWSLEAPAPTGATIDRKTGVLQWIPPESQAPGTTAFKIAVTDTGTPPMKGTMTLSVPVSDDAAAYTILTGITVDESGPLAWLYDRLQDRMHYLRLDTEYTFGDITFRIEEMSEQEIVLHIGNRLGSLEIGNSLRQINPIGNASATEGRPAG